MWIVQSPKMPGCPIHAAAFVASEWGPNFNQIHASANPESEFMPQSTLHKNGL